MRKPFMITEINEGQEVSFSVRAVKVDDLVVVRLDGTEVALSTDAAIKFANLIDQAIEFNENYYYGEE